MVRLLMIGAMMLAVSGCGGGGGNDNGSGEGTDDYGAPYVTRATVQQVQNGDTRQEVEQALGKTEDSDTTSVSILPFSECLRYAAPDGGNWWVCLEGNKVAKVAAGAYPP